MIQKNSDPTLPRSNKPNHTNQSNQANQANQHCQIMAIINVTPDSFSQDGLMRQQDNVIELAIKAANKAIQAGASILDIGGESSRPGAHPIDTKTEISRVLPVIHALKKIPQCPTLSIDTTKAEVASQAIEAGVEIINDISALSDREMAPLIATSGAHIVLMHNNTAWGSNVSAPHTQKISDDQGDHQSRQEHTKNMGFVYQSHQYHDVVEEVYAALMEKIKYAHHHNIEPAKIIIDPGIGFGKSCHDNIAILANIARFKQAGFQLLIGASRKGFIGQLLGLAIEQRLAPSLAVVSSAFYQGADIIRVHDVAESCQCLAMHKAIVQQRNQ